MNFDTSTWHFHLKSTSIFIVLSLPWIFCCLQTFSVVFDGWLLNGNLHLICRKRIEVLALWTFWPDVSKVWKWNIKVTNRKPDFLFCFFIHRYWWRNALYINNLFSRDDLCMNWTWSMACEMQFFLIFTLILFVYAK